MDAAPEQGAEEAEALDVVHVEVGEEHVDRRPVPGRAVAEPPDAGARVEHDQVATSPRTSTHEVLPP